MGLTVATKPALLLAGCPPQVLCPVRGCAQDFNFTFDPVCPGPTCRKLPLAALIDSLSSLNPGLF